MRHGVTKMRNGKFRVDTVKGNQSVFVGVYDTREAADAALAEAEKFRQTLEKP